MHRVAEALRPAVLVGVGAAFEFVAGTLPRAPQWMSATGLEWLYRLAREPARLGPRYLVRDPRFAVIVLRELLHFDPYGNLGKEGTRERLKKLLSPRYLASRVAVTLYEWRHPDAPWLTRAAIAWLEAHLRPEHRGFEWGSGTGTLWFARRSASLVSVEHARPGPPACAASSPQRASRTWITDSWRRAPISR